MHDDEIEIDEALVRGLLADQHPQWAAMPLTRIASGGTVNAIFRLGDELAVRVPLRLSQADDVDVLERWLPVFARALPLAVPELIAVGRPTAGFAAPWWVQRWLDGEPLTEHPVADWSIAATTLGAVVLAIRGVEVTPDAPPPGPANSWRGVPLAWRDPFTRSALEQLGHLIDVAAATAAWESALVVPAWEGPPVWMHGDLMRPNLLAAEGRITAIIDWGCLASGDPAYDVMPAWVTLPAAVRPVFRAGVDVDDATWARGRGLALSQALLALSYYEHTNPTMVDAAHFTIDAVLADQE
jgi:aminoglycoside phosphotransferase (APT) family kinase protein